MRAAANHAKITSHMLDIGKGALLATIISVAAIFALALGLKALPISDAVLAVVNQVIKVLSVASGAYLGVGRGGENGFLKGAGTGILYMLLGTGLYHILGGESQSLLGVLSDMLMGGAAGGIAGILTANLAPKSGK